MAYRKISCTFVLLFILFSKRLYGEDKIKIIPKIESSYKSEIIVNVSIINTSEEKLFFYPEGVYRYINIIDKKVFKNLLKYKKLYTQEINTAGIQYNEIWVKKFQDVANAIKKYPNTIVIVEGFRNTELSEKENIAMSKEHALFVSSILRDVYNVSNTMAAIGRGLDKNENLIYNCVIISLIKDIDPSASIQ